jgi:hypothetical protein
VTDNKRAADDAEREAFEAARRTIAAKFSHATHFDIEWELWQAALSSRADVAADRTADRHYIAGMQVGYNFGVEENSAGMQKCIEQRQKDIRESKIDEPSRADGGKGEAVYQMQLRGPDWADVEKRTFDDLPRIRRRIVYTAPQAECAPQQTDAEALYEAWQSTLKHVETQPGSPNFDGAEAYEAHLKAECAPREAQPVACPHCWEVDCLTCGTDAAPTPERADAAPLAQSAEQDRIDAKRWRWLKKNDFWLPCSPSGTEAAIDAAIDRARQSGEEGK